MGQGALLPEPWKRQFGDWLLFIAVVVPIFLLTVRRGLIPEPPISIWKTIGAAWHLLMAMLVMYGVTQTPWDPWMTFFLLAMVPGAAIASITLRNRFREAPSTSDVTAIPTGMKEPSSEPIE